MDTDAYYSSFDTYYAKIIPSIIYQGLIFTWKITMACSPRNLTVTKYIIFVPWTSRIEYSLLTYDP